MFLLNRPKRRSWMHVLCCERNGLNYFPFAVNPFNYDWYNHLFIKFYDRYNHEYIARWPSTINILLDQNHSSYGNTTINLTVTKGCSSMDPSVVMLLSQLMILFSGFSYFFFVFVKIFTHLKTWFCSSNKGILFAVTISPSSIVHRPSSIVLVP